MHRVHVSCNEARDFDSALLVCIARPRNFQSFNLAYNSTRLSHTNQLFNLGQFTNHDLQVVSTTSLGSKPESSAINTTNLPVFLSDTHIKTSVSSRCTTTRRLEAGSQRC